MSLSPNLTIKNKTQSCAECRRRRIRCDGQVIPCSQCVYYQVPELCHYPARKTRKAPSVKEYADVSNAYERGRGILNRLFPKHSLEDLEHLSCDQLLALLPDASLQVPSSSSPSLSPAQPSAQLAEALCVAGACDSQTATILDLEPSPDQDFEWNETEDDHIHRQFSEDDVNGLSVLFETGKHSYLGISSVPTIMRVMVHSSSQLRKAIQKRQETQSLRPRPYRTTTPNTIDRCTRPIINDEASLVDAYFRTVHGITPMIDEPGFRQCRAQGGGLGRARGPWLALYNMVLTLGYIAANDDSQPGHGIYFSRASRHLDMSCFASGHIYTLQALALYSGYYLHYLNRPNMASAIMGAAHRMAVAMGLHQVPPSSRASSGPSSNVDARARTWWSLFCLDVWAGTTLGRPIGGMWDVESMTSSPMHLGTDLDYQSISIRTSASFCRIAARIQDRMARLPLMLLDELKQFDQELLAWHADVHPIFRDPKHSPELIRLASLILQYRYLDQRMTLYRPYLLLRSLSASSRSEHSTRNDTAAIADTCVTIARETIELIKGNWYPNQLVAWNSSWFLFQAVLVVLLGLSSATPETDVQPLERDIEESLRLFNEMCRWRGPAAHTHDLIQFIYESRALEEHDLGVEELLSDEALMILLGFEPNSKLAWAGLFDGEQGSNESGMFGFSL
ncbi:unnamed protein product [Clonostachys rhizophaga]|uniref:Zn(2)-C6 fungal-type domain-containing protein n=1 Tax=Clonostachys rhizophaga TaxID=160324 RepID=A0A9N9YPU3_9HYPO|nr:unnamed protein product [Clonostachys rhizophaga]